MNITKLQNLWDTLKRPNLPIPGIEKGYETKSESIDNLFDKIIVENLQA